MAALRYMGFCGIDDSISPEHLRLISHHYPWVEWGALFRSDLAGTPRYPSDQWIEKLRVSYQKSHGEMRLAAHLCCDRCQEVIEGNARFAQNLYDIGFRRVQVNATAANGVDVNPDRIYDYVQNIRKCITSVPNMEWIIQCNTETSAIWQELIKSPPLNMSLLYDASCGKGIGIVDLPSPADYPEIPCGYAGGIGPTTIGNILVKVGEASKSLSPKQPPVWIDMESSLRTKVLLDTATNTSTDIFSIDKCFSCIEAGLQWGMAEHI